MGETPENNDPVMEETSILTGIGSIENNAQISQEINLSTEQEIPENNIPIKQEIYEFTVEENPENSAPIPPITPTLEFKPVLVHESPEKSFFALLEAQAHVVGPIILPNLEFNESVLENPVIPAPYADHGEYRPTPSRQNRRDSSEVSDSIPTPPGRNKRKNRTIEKLPDKVLLNIFSYLSHREICRMATVCKRWRMVAYDTKLWTHVSLRPEISGLHVGSLESLLALISIRFGPSLRYIELPIELITHTVLHELASKCPNLTHMLLDFSTAMQLHDFSEMQAFPTKLRYLCICLSEVIFMEGFMRKIYNFINGLEILHLIGTYEKVEEEEEEIYEVINVHKLKSATPNLRVINLYGINFVDDSHIDAFSSNCIQLECLAVNYCNKVTGSTMKTLFQRSRRLTCLLMNGCSLQSEYVMQVEWEKSSVTELDVTATDLSTECLIDMLTRIPNLRFLSAGQINGFNDTVLKAWIEAGTARNLVALDVDSSDNLSDEALLRFLSRHGSQLWGLVLSGMPHITDQLWQSVLQLLTNAKILIMGTQERLGVNIHVDQLMDGIANNCPNLERLELRWDPENLRFSDKSQKAIDILRVKCLKLKCLVLSDGRYYEIVKANFERADRTTVVRTSTNCRVSNYYLLSNYKDLIFN